MPINLACYNFGCNRNTCLVKSLWVAYKKFKKIFCSMKHVVISSVIGKEESSTRVNVSIIKWSYTRYDLLELSKEVVVAIGPN